MIPAAHFVRTLLRVLGNILRTLCIAAAGLSFFGFVFGLFLWQGGDPVQTRDILYPFLVFAGCAAASVGLRRWLKQSQPPAPPVLAESPAAELTPEERRLIANDEKVFAAYERRRKFIRWGVILSPVWLLGGCVAYGLLDAMRGLREASLSKQCLNNMRYLEAGLPEFEKTQHHPPRTVEEFVAWAQPPMDFHCAAHGSYTLTRDKAGKAMLECSFHGSFEKPHYDPHPFM